jgi:hypothetical protein
MQVKILAKGEEGLPTTSLVAELTPADLSYSHGALWGPLTATVTLAGSRDDAFTIADQWLGNAVEIYSPDGDWCWDGLIWTIEFTYGRRSRRRSLEGFTDDVRVYYTLLESTTSTIGGPGLRSSEDDTLIATYGRIEYVHNGGELSLAQATSTAARLLAERSRLLWLPESGTLGADAGGDVAITLECYGWYRTLWYRTLPQSQITVTGDDLVSDLITGALGSADFISTDTSRIAETTGYEAPAYRPQVLFIGEYIKQVLAAAPGSTFRLDRGRVPVLEADKRLSTTPDYLEDTFGLLTNTAGQPVPLYLVRPDSVVRQQDFVPIGQFSDAEVDKISAVYLAETEWRMPGVLSFRTAVAGERGEVE